MHPVGEVLRVQGEAARQLLDVLAAARGLLDLHRQHDIGGQTIVVKPRSVLAAMRYLSKGIVVPEADLGTKQVFALLEAVFALRGGDVPPISTV